MSHSPCWGPSLSRGSLAPTPAAALAARTGPRAVGALPASCGAWLLGGCLPMASVATGCVLPGLAGRHMRDQGEEKLQDICEGEWG